MTKLNLGDKQLPIDALKRHLVCFGASGSGKTVFLKAVIEECVLQDIPAIVIDSQGDFASLPLKEKDNPFHDKAKFQIFTPGSNQGIPLCFHPLGLLENAKNTTEVLSYLSQTLAGLCGYKPDDLVQSALYLLLEEQLAAGNTFHDLEELSSFILSLDEAPRNIVTKKHLQELGKKLTALTIGNKGKMFNEGVPFAPGKLFQKGKVSILYMNALVTQQEKATALSLVALSIYQWMLNNPSSKMQGIFVLDELAPYLPATGKVPVSKEPLVLLLRQARKYGIGLVLSSQSPGDIDYKAVAQCGTWAIGRLGTKQEQEKINHLLEKKQIETLSKLKAGEFYLISSDHFPRPELMKVRWLYSKHETVSQQQLSSLVPEEQRMVEKKEIVKKQKNGKKVLGFPPRYGQQELREAMLEQRKKMFKLFGSNVEDLVDMQFLLQPIQKLAIKVKKKQLLGLKSSYETITVFAKPTQILVFSGNDRYKEYDVKDLPELSETTVQIFKAVQKENKPVTAATLAARTGLTNQTTRTHLQDLKKRGYVGIEKQGRVTKYSSLESIKLPKIANLHSLVDIEDLEERGWKRQKEPEPTNITRFLETWYPGCSVVENEVCFYPVVKGTFTKKEKRRAVTISAITKKPF